MRFFVGLISQVAEDLWEVKNKTIRNLTRDGIDIKEYKKGLVKQSSFLFSIGLPLLRGRSPFLTLDSIIGMKQIEKLQAKKGSLV